MTQVKICGIRGKDHALAAIEAEANFIGLVFAPSQRQVSLAQADKIASVIKKHSNTTEVVGVFVNMPASEVNKISHSCHLDWVQLSGDESWEYCREINRPLIKAVRIRSGQRSKEICNYLTHGARVLSGKKYLYLLDSQSKGQYGGTGITSDWSLAHEVAKSFSVILAGGLTPENVARAIETVEPWGVDVSSGVELGGMKSIAKIKAFTQAVRRADAKKR